MCLAGPVKVRAAVVAGEKCQRGVCDVAVFNVRQGPANLGTTRTASQDDSLLACSAIDM